MVREKEFGARRRLIAEIPDAAWGPGYGKVRAVLEKIIGGPVEDEQDFSPPIHIEVTEPTFWDGWHAGTAKLLLSPCDRGSGSPDGARRIAEGAALHRLRAIPQPVEQPEFVRERSTCIALVQRVLVAPNLRPNQIFHRPPRSVSTPSVEAAST